MLDRRRRNSEDELEQDKASQQLVSPAPGGFNEGTPASGMELDLPRVHFAHGKCGGAGNSGAEHEPESTSDGRGCLTGGLLKGKG